MCLSVKYMFARALRRLTGSPAERIQQLEKQVQDLQAKLTEPAAKKTGIRGLIAEKGVPFVIWYGTIWAGGVAGFYAALQYDLISYKSIVDFTKTIGIDKLYDVEQLDPKKGKVAVAFIANEIAEPIRIPLALVTLNPILRLLRR